MSERKIIDVHAHIVPEVDDGARSIKESCPASGAGKFLPRGAACPLKGGEGAYHDRQPVCPGGI